MFHKELFLALFHLFLITISLHRYHLLSAVFSMLTTWPSGPPPPHRQLSLRLMGLSLSFGKEDSGILANPHFMALWSPFLIRPAQFVQAFPMKPVLFCKLSTGLGSITNIFFPSPPLKLSLCSCFTFLASVLFFLTLAHVAENILFLLFYQAAMETQFFISFGQ